MKLIKANNKSDHILLWVFFISKGIKDNTDLMRASMLCMAVCQDGATLESVKDSSGYKSCLYDIPDCFLTDEYITEMLEFDFTKQD
jgi:hypothetical protein